MQPSIFGLIPGATGSGAMASEFAPTETLACVPGAIPDDERSAHFVLTKRLFAQEAFAREKLPDGYKFLFPPEAVEEIDRFVVNEQKCCPFLNFTLNIPPTIHAALELRIVGPLGTREFLEAELFA